MIVEKNFSDFVIFSEDSVLNALNKINQNKARIIFAVSESGILLGVLSDGDIRRWLTSISKIDLNVSVSEVINKEFEFAYIDDEISAIEEKLSERVLAVPLLDHNQRLVSVALQFHRDIEIGGRVISADSPAFIIAEIGNNHNGCFENAKKLVDEAVRAGADCVKFQMRDLSSLYVNVDDENDVSQDLGAQYTLDLLRRFQLSDENLLRIFDYCYQQNILPLCTPWDISSLNKLEQYGMQAYKIASADFTNYDLIKAVAKTGKPLLCSTGMTQEHEIKQGITFLQSLSVQYILLHCNSTYPAPFKDINLKYMQHLEEITGGLVGYSGHERDIHVAVAAVSLGAKVIEKHFTLDKTWEGIDHKVSLLPFEFAKMVEGIRQVESALGIKVSRTISQGELMNREMLAKSLVASVSIKAGECITEGMINVKSPGQGIQPNRKNDLIGTVIQRDIQKDTCFYLSDLEQSTGVSRDYNFTHCWGVPVRYHDLAVMLKQSNMDLLEIHLSYKDMELDFRDYIECPLPLELVVHAPELFAGDHTLDLCSVDSDYRQRSIKELQRVINLTRKLTPFFLNTDIPCIIVNVGGFTSDKHLLESERQGLYDVLAESLSQLDTDGVELIPQTMPPFPWHFGGQQFHNLFMDAESIQSFCEQFNMRICLDVSHSKLACNHFNWSFTKFLEILAPYVAHLHLADSKGVDGEGLQVATGDIDWDTLASIVNESMPNSSFIPETWQGHKNKGEGFWQALELLESYAL